MKPGRASLFNLDHQKLMLVWLLILTGYRILCLLQPHMGVFYDEAYYLHWSQDLDWGYYSKPPMVAWLIYIATQAFGISAFTAKIFSPLLYGATAWLVYLIARKLSQNTKLALVAGMIFSTTLLTGFNSLFITTDTPLFFFWALSTLLFIHCLEKNNWILWLSLGITMGLGMLSKYTFAALPLGFLFFTFFTHSYRSLFTQLRPWVSVMLALIIFTPNLLWNWQYDFISFSHTREIAKLDGPLVDPVALVTFLVTQCIIFGIVWSFAIINKRSHIQLAFKSPNGFYLLLWTSIPIITIIGLQALLSRAFANWAGPFIISASILAAAAVTKLNLRWLYFSISLHLILLSTLYHWPLLLQSLSIEQSKKNSPYFRLAGWRELVSSIPQISTLPKQTQLLSPNRDLLAYAGFYNNIHFNDLFYWNPNNKKHIDNHYDLKNNIENHSDATSNNYILLTKNQPSDILSRFENVEYIGYFEHKVSSEIIRGMHLYKVSEFRGYFD